MQALTSQLTARAAGIMAAVRPTNSAKRDSRKRRDYLGQYGMMKSSLGLPEISSFVNTEAR
jgi:hypothetical protein